MKKRVTGHIYVYSILLIALLVLTGFFAKDVVTNVNKGLDLKGGYDIVFNYEALSEQELPEASVIIANLQNRLKLMGYSDVRVTTATAGDKNIVRVTVDNSNDLAAITSLIASPGVVSFRNSEDLEIIDASILRKNGASVFLQDEVPMLVLGIEDPSRFYTLTQTLAQQSDKTLVTWVDFVEGIDSYAQESANAEAGIMPRYISAATVTNGIYGDAQIGISASYEDAKLIAGLINAGPLPVALERSHTVAVDGILEVGTSMNILYVGVGALALIALAMIVKYRLLGFTFATVLPGYVVLVLAAFTSFGGVVNLATVSAMALGTFSLIFSVCVLFEKITNEVSLGRSLQTAYENAKSSSLPYEINSFVYPALITFVAFFIGSTVVKKFSMMLLVAIGSGIVACVLVRMLVSNLMTSGLFEGNTSMYAVNKEASTNKKPLNIALIAIVAAIALNLAGFVFKGNSTPLASTNGKDTVLVLYLMDPKTEADIAKAIEELDYAVESIKFSLDNSQFVEVVVKETLDTESTASLILALESKLPVEASFMSCTSNELTKSMTETSFVLAIVTLITLFVVNAQTKKRLTLNAFVSIVASVVVGGTMIFIGGVNLDTNIVAILLALFGVALVEVTSTAMYISEGYIAYKTDKQINDNIGKIVYEGLSQKAKENYWVIAFTSALVIAVVGLSINVDVFMYIVRLLSLVALVPFAIVMLVFPKLSVKKVDSNASKSPKKKKEKKSEPSEYVVPGVNDIR